MSYESVVVQNLKAMRNNLLAAKENVKLCGFSYEVEDTLNELIYFAEFGLGEIGIDYSDGVIHDFDPSGDEHDGACMCQCCDQAEGKM